MKIRRLVSVLCAFLALVSALPLRATIDAALQMQLGNPTGATSDPNNTAHYLLQRAQYALDYSNNNGEPNWVSWNLTTADVGGSGRSNNFIPDPDLPPNFYPLVTGDYTGSGYDRGHMCPSADRTVTAADNQVTFILSNILPQAPDNNQGVWANFESYCRSLASAGNELLITSGGSGYGGSRILSGKAAIPGYVWKIVVVVPVGPGSAVSRVTSSTRIIAIKIPNIAGVRTTPWETFVTSVAQIEADTGYHFLTELPASVANALRNVVDGQAPVGSPVITSQPASQTTVVNGTATFSVAATGDDPLTYQWLHDEDEIAGATSATFTLSSVQALDAGSYTVVVTNGVGSATSNPASLVVLGVPPSIVTAPTAQTVNAGSNVAFSVVASGSPTLTYQWRKDSAPLPSATSSTLTLNNVQAADIGSYDVVVSNSVNSVTSAAAALQVNASAPFIVTQPASRTAATGSNAGFSVVAAGTAPLTYQWRKAGAPLSEGGSVSGVTTATLLLSSVSAASAGDYDVVITNSLGFATSALATLTVNPPPPQVLQWNFGTAAAFTAGTTNAPLTEVTGGDVIQGNNFGSTTMLTASSVSSGYAGSTGNGNAGAAARTGALVLATNPPTAGSAYFEFSASAADGKRLLVTGLTFGSRSTSTGPQAYTVYASLDSFATSAVIASGSLTNNSAWTLNAPALAPLTGNTGGTISFRIYGYNGTGNAASGTANWRIDDLSLSASAVFPPPVAPVVVSTAPASGATSVPIATPITVTFNEAVAFTGSWFTINSALNGPMSAAVTGGPTTYTLTPPSTFANNDTITVAIDASKVVDQATGTIAGSGVTSFSFATESYVPPTPPAVTTSPSSQTATAGTSVSFSVAASGTAPLTYQWRKGGTPITGNSSATTPTLTLAAVTPSDAGSYDCVVSNVAGSDVSAAATLTVNLVAPTLSTPPSAQLVAAGGNATFSVVANGTGPFTYQWRFNGTPLSDGPVVTGTNTDTLRLNGVTLANSGSYDVVITNPAGSVTATATLAVVSGAPSVIYWDFATATPTSGMPAGVTNGAVGQGNNNGTTPLLSTTSPSSGYAGVSGTNNAGAAAKIGALNKNAGGSTYFDVTLEPPAGRQLAVGGISFGSRSTGTGPQAFAVFSSLDGYGVPLAAGTLNSNSTWQLFTPSFAGATSAPGTPITFRIYGYAGTGSPGANTANWRIDDLKVTAALLALPAAAPTVASTSPANGTANVTVNAPISITFDQAVNVTSNWFSIVGASSGPVTGAVSSGGPTTFTLTPASSLAYGDNYTVTVLAAQVTEQATGTLAMASDYSFSFSTAAPALPTITTPPQSQTATVGDTVTFSVAATSSAPLTYQWRHNQTPIVGNASATTASLSLTAITVVDAGSYDCVVSNAGGPVTSDAATLTVNPAAATITLGSLSAVFDGAPHAATATTMPSGLSVSFTYNGIAAAPVDVGSYAVVATITDPNYIGSATGTLVIAPASAPIVLSNLTQIYDGSPKSVTVTTARPNAFVYVTYDGSATPPTYPGNYAVVASTLGSGFATVSGTLTITTLVISRHAPTLNGGIDGSIQQLLPEAATFNSNAWVSGDLLVPGLPTVRLNGSPTYGGTLDGLGAATPTNYTLTLNSGAVLRHAVRRINAVTMPTVSTPPSPTGTRNVAINSAGQSPGDFATLHNLTLNSNAGEVIVPPGTYGTFVANSNSSFTLGVADATTPAIYNLEGLTLNSSAQIKVVGPIILTVANSVTLNGPLMGAAAHPEWLQLRIASGGLTLNSNVTVHGFVTAPNGTVTINSNSMVKGGVVADRITINSNGQIDASEP